MSNEAEGKVPCVSGKLDVAVDRSKEKLQDPLVWIDLEMTGLDVTKDVIIEIACIVTDGSLMREIEGPEIAIKHGDEVFAAMGQWCQTQHTKSGLVTRCKQSPFYMPQAERLVLNFIKQHVEHNGAILAGNSIHQDKIFLSKDMPTLHNYLHYRILDVSSIKEICKRWYPRDHGKCPRKKNTHTAMSDIRESIEELKYYRGTIFKS